MPRDADAHPGRYDEEYYRTNYGDNLARRLPTLTREQYWARWLGRRVDRSQPVLDLGSGLGWLALSARTRGLRTVSVDISQFSAQRLRAEHGLSVVVGSAMQVPVRAGSIAAVVALDVLEHLDGLDAALAEIRRVLRPEGFVIISVPNTRGIGARVKRQRGTWFGDRDETHAALLTPDAWVRALTDADFTLERRGSDFLWDPPYPVHVPDRAQRAVLLPLHRVTSRAFGALRWSGGENLVLVGRAS